MGDIMKRTLVISLAAMWAVNIGCSLFNISNSLPQKWDMVNDAGETAIVTVSPFTYSGTFSETSDSPGWYMTYPGGSLRIPISGTISHFSQGDHWSFAITVQSGGVSLLGSGEGYSNGNFPNATTASGTVHGLPPICWTLS